MNKTAIKNFAVWARRELIEKVSQKALQYGITEKKIEDADADTINGKLLTPSEKTQRKALINKIKIDGYQQTIEEISYTWFNRFIALRFMEVNDYLPEHIRVFTNENNEFKPQILTEAITIDLVGLDKKKLFAFKEANDDEGLYKYLIITQCNALNEILPKMFQKLEDYTELLFPDFILREDSVLKGMIEQIPAEDFEDAVQIIGWMYQYYNSEPKDQVFADLKKNIKITKEKIPAATQLFTPDWIVRYMVENSLGRLWTEGHPDQSPKAEWRYYLEEADQTEEVKVELAKIKAEYAKLTPEQIKCIDPCMGSGHILCYMFDVLIQIYRQYGYSDRDAVASIVQNNIYGLDIDSRAAQLAYFAVMMKAVQYDKRFLTRGIEPNVYEVKDSHEIDETIIQSFVNNDAELTKNIKLLVNDLANAKEYGSLTEVSQLNYEKLFARVEELKKESDMMSQQASELLVPLILLARVLSQKYDVVVTNPPYLGNKSMTVTMANECKKQKLNNFYQIFLLKCIDFLKSNRKTSLVIMDDWLKKSKSESFRRNVFTNHIESLNDLGSRAFPEISGEIVQVCVINLMKRKSNNEIGIYFDQTNTIDKENACIKGLNKHYICKKLFDYIPRYSIIPNITDNEINVFKKSETLEKIAEPKSGLTTGNMDRYIHFWYESDISKINKKWFPVNIGGKQCKWYGNRFFTIDWENEGAAIKSEPGSTLANMSYQQSEGLTWGKIGSGNLAVTYSNNSFFTASGLMAFPKKADLYYVMALMNSHISKFYLHFFCGGIDVLSGDVANIPIIKDENIFSEVTELSKSCTNILKNNFDAIETSIDFKKLPIVNVNKSKLLKNIIAEHLKQQQSIIEDLTEKEKKIDLLFENVYHTNTDLNQISYCVGFEKQDEKSLIIQLISYSVGCMFGRYSLDDDGIVFAGGTFNSNNYKTFEADKDAIIPICDDDSFEDDIVKRFEDFICEVYGKENLEENLRFIADNLGGNGQSRDVIRKYFINSFYKDHLQLYQKKPIYWLFNSGDANGLKCLVYMHRYQKDTIARIRTDYVHDRQGVYENRIEELNQKIKSASGAEKIKLSNQLKDTKAKAEELHKYEEKIHHLADKMIEIDLDDGVKHNYEIFKDVLAPLK